MEQKHYGLHEWGASLDRMNAGFLHRLALANGADIVSNGSILMWSGGPSDTGMNGIALADWSDGEADAGISGVEGYYRSKGCAFTWTIGPMSKPGDLPFRLLRRGYRMLGAAPGMIFEISGPEHIAELGGRRTAPKGLIIREVSDSNGLEAYSDLAASALLLSRHRTEHFKRLLRVDSLSKPTPVLPCYVAYMNGLPVGGGCTLAEDDIHMAGIFCLAVATRYRGKGIGGSIMLHMLGELSNRGCGLVSLSATPSGYPLYNNLGFREVGGFTTFASPGS